MRTNDKPPYNSRPKDYASSLYDLAKAELSLSPIGFVESAYKERFAAPRQPALWAPEPAIIHLQKGLNLEQAVADLNSFSHIWVIYWMHLNQGWNPTVVPPRGPKERRGLLATRAPHRPNPIGLSVVQLEKVNGLSLHIAGHDMLDGTPVLDIKPYLPYSDAIPEASHGWLDHVGIVPQKDPVA